MMDWYHIKIKYDEKTPEEEKKEKEIERLAYYKSYEDQLQYMKDIIKNEGDNVYTYEFMKIVKDKVAEIKDKLLKRKVAIDDY